MGHWAILNAWVYLIVRLVGKPYVICPAGALPIYGRSHILKRIYNQIIGKKIIRNADLHLAITSAEFSAYMTYGIPAENIHVIPNGVEINFINSNFGESIQKYILFVGRLNQIKGPDLLVQAFSDIAHDFPDIQLILAGPDEGMASELKKLISQFSLQERIKIIGYIGGPEKQKIISQALIFAVPSRQEAMSIVALEAGAQKVPVLITNQCGFNDVSKFGGEVVPATREGLREGLRNMLNDRNNLKKRGQVFFEYVEQNFSWQKIARLHVDLFQKLIH